MSASIQQAFVLAGAILITLCSSDHLQAEEYAQWEVVVAIHSAELKVGRRSVGSVSRGDLIVAERVQDGWLRVDDGVRKKGWLNSRHVQKPEDVAGEEWEDLQIATVNLQMLKLASEGRHTIALAVGRRVLQVIETIVGKEQVAYAKAAEQIAALHQIYIGDFDRAELLIREALDVYAIVHGKDHRDYAAALERLATLYFALGDHKKGEVLFREALGIYKKVLGEEVYATHLSHLAALYLSAGRIQSAANLFREALALMDEAGRHDFFYGYRLCQLGSTYRQLGQLARAEELYLKSLEVIGHGDHRADTLTMLAAVYEEMGKPNEAELRRKQALEASNQALNSFQRQASQPEASALGAVTRFFSLYSLSWRYYCLGEYARAEPLYLQLLNTESQFLGEDHMLTAFTRLSMACLYHLTNRPQQAIGMLNAALEIEQSNLLRVFAFTSERTIEQVRSTHGRSLDLLINIVASQAESGDGAVEAALTWALRRKGVILDTQCRFREVQRLLHEDEDVAKRVRELRRLRQQLAIVSVAQVTEMGLSQLAELPQKRTRYSEQAEQLEAELNRRLSKVVGERASWKQVTVRATRHRLPAETALVELLKVSMADFRPNFAMGIAASPTGWKPARYFAFVLTANESEPVQMIDLGEAEAIDKAIWNLRRQIEEFDPRFDVESEAEKGFRSMSADLYRLTVAPIRSALGAANTIYVAPDGELNRVPFAALVDEDGKYLCESYQFVYLGSGRDLLRQYPKVAKGTIVFTAPDYDLGSGDRRRLVQELLPSTEAVEVAMRSAVSRDTRSLRWKPLAGAQAEAGLVRDALGESSYGPVRVFAGEKALEEMFKSVRSARVLHVATHGYFVPYQRPESQEHATPLMPDIGFAATRGPSAATPFAAAGGLAHLRGRENPLLRSGLVLAGANRIGDTETKVEASSLDDGWGTAQEIAMMNLRGTELVVLSACETGLGDVRTGEGVHGLRRAFLYAGARTLVMSLFKVPDKETQELMGSFYNSLKGGKDKLTALHDAQRELISQRRKDHGAAHPFYWASFVLVGDPH